MRRIGVTNARRGVFWPRLVLFVLLGWLTTAAGQARGADASAGSPAAASPGGEMSSAGWFERIAMQLETEATSDISMLPETPGALAREWRSFSRDGSAWGSLANFG